MTDRHRQPISIIFIRLHFVSLFIQLVAAASEAEAETEAEAEAEARSQKPEARSRTAGWLSYKSLHL